MKTYPSELNYYSRIKDEVCARAPHFSTSELDLLNNKIQELRENAKKFSHIHRFFQVLPFLFLGMCFYALYTWALNTELPSIIKVLSFSTLHGILTYQFVIYALHEGAGHGLLRQVPILSKACFNASRLFFADPEYYKRRHTGHHNFLGTEKDGAFVHFVLPKRILVSMIPGAGVLFKNDYKIAQGEEVTVSLIISALIGLLFAGFQMFLISGNFSLTEGALSFLVLSPWVAMVLDRSRETLEHCGLPDQPKYGSRELGLSPLGLLIAGGPWGQPCHFSHHFAPDLNWYQQIQLHFYIKEIASKNLLDFYGFNTTVGRTIAQAFRFYTRGVKAI